ncbi:hypothetical protein [Paraburkholderia antibiotica]|uniref:Uncharacterized protein n=1 Tax=Paraburkholderia antibiotica TaxID=2728839 RepID=A0A7X9ZVZ3_9BURK|nr:hypothetical protein [Paraburkholderia antibiotica]NML30156.1 hypothetical protein [Paraburkholderia antibiotica]
MLVVLLAIPLATAMSKTGLAYPLGDYWKIGALIVLWSMAVVVFIEPLYWRF